MHKARIGRVERAARRRLPPCQACAARGLVVLWPDGMRAMVDAYLGAMVTDGAARHADIAAPAVLAPWTCDACGRVHTPSAEIPVRWPEDYQPAALAAAIGGEDDA